MVIPSQARLLPRSNPKRKCATGGGGGVQPNFRGSTGYGEDCIQALPGHAGVADVADCMAALTAAIEKGALGGRRVQLMSADVAPCCLHASIPCRNVSRLCATAPAAFWKLPAVLVPAKDEANSGLLRLRLSSRRSVTSFAFDRVMHCSSLHLLYHCNFRYWWPVAIGSTASVGESINSSLLFTSSQKYSMMVIMSTPESPSATFGVHRSSYES